jgi:hypothetical protein
LTLEHQWTAVLEAYKKAGTYMGFSAAQTKTWLESIMAFFRTSTKPIGPHPSSPGGKIQKSSGFSGNSRPCRKLLKTR